LAQTITIPKIQNKGELSGSRLDFKLSAVKTVSRKLTVTEANETVKSSVDIDVIEKAMTRGAAFVPARRNIERRIAEAEKEIKELKLKQEGFLYELQIAAPERIEKKESELQRLQQRGAEEQDAMSRLRAQTQAVAGDLAGLPKPVALMGIGIGQDDALAARRFALKSRVEELQSQISRVEAELQVSERLVSEAETSVERMEVSLDGLKSQAASGGQ
jgi:chromosome segregation ATPase